MQRSFYHLRVAELEGCDMGVTKLQEDNLATAENEAEARTKSYRGSSEIGIICCSCCRFWTLKL